MSTGNRHTISRKMWIVTADWYDERHHYFGDPWHSKNAAIRAFKDEFGWKWRKAKRDGWRCVPCTVTWIVP